MPLRLRQKIQKVPRRNRLAVFSAEFIQIKIKSPVASARRIKSRATPRASRLALHILPNRHLHPANPAQNRARVPLPARPDRNRMTRQLLMAILASPINPATSHLDGDNVQRRMPMQTPRLHIQIDAAHLWTFFSRNGDLLSTAEKNRTQMPLRHLSPD